MKKIILCVTAAVFLLVLTACGKEKNEGENKITIGFMSSLGAVPYIYALEEGFYEDAGLDVEIKIFTNANDRDAALIGKHIDGVNTDYVMLANLLENNFDLVATATTEDKFILVANEVYKNQVTNIASTNNAKVGTFENGVLSYLVSKVATDNGIQYTQLGFPAVPVRKAALEAKTIDMAILPEPFATQVKNGQAIWNNIDSGSYVSCLAFNKDFLEKNEALLKKFFNTTDKAINQLKLDSYDDYKNYIVKHNILTTENVDLITIQQFNNLVLPKESDFDPVMTWMVDKGLITTKYELKDITYNWKN